MSVIARTTEEILATRMNKPNFIPKIFYFGRTEKIRGKITISNWVGLSN
jgi:hypothetical protein